MTPKQGICKEVLHCSNVNILHYGNYITLYYAKGELFMNCSENFIGICSKQI